MLQNSSLLESAYNSALNDSAGSAQEELDKYLESIEGKITRLTNNVQEFWATFIDTDLVKDAIDLLADLVKGLTNVVDKIGALPVVVGAATAVFSIFKTKSGGRARKIVFNNYLCCYRRINYHHEKKYAHHAYMCT